jgi:dihydrofolate reductase
MSDEEWRTNMRKLIVFNNVTLDGYFTGVNGDLSWVDKNNQDEEWNAFVEENALGGGVLLFGRVTYEMMAGYWPSSMARENDPVVAENINQMPKFVFSRTLDQLAWQNTRLIKGDIVLAVRMMKDEPGPDMAILGSGSIVSQLADEGLIDEFQIVVNPVAIGSGRTMFEGIKEKINLKLIKSRTFNNGNVLLCYEPVL